MKKASKKRIVLLLLIIGSNLSLAARAEVVYPIAIFDFVEKGNHLSGMGEKISQIVFANLVVDPNISLVDREELTKLEEEAVLNLSGMVNIQQANQIGQLTGARIIVTGTIFEIENRLMIVAKIIGSETSRVLGASVNGDSNNSIVELVEELSQKINDVITNNSGTLVAKQVDKKERLAELKETLKSADKPSLAIAIKERHINRAASDPAAETEMTLYAIETGFEVLAGGSRKWNKADIVVTGEGFTEFATRKGDLVGVKARLEVKAVEQATNRVLFVDRQTELEVDLSEMIAGKKALQRAAEKIAERMLPKIAGL